LSDSKSKNKDKKTNEGQKSSIAIWLYAIAIIIAVAIIYVSYSFTQAGSYSVKVEFSPVNYHANTTMYPFNTLSAKLTVINIGTSKLSKLPMLVYVNGNKLHSYVITLPPKSEVNLSISYTFNNSGNYTFEAVADPANLLNLKNRDLSHQSFAVPVAVPEKPDLYVSIPNLNITSTKEFTLYPKGIAFSSIEALNYNISYFKNLFGPAYPAVGNSITDLALLVHIMNGVYANYSSGARISSLWMNGNITAQYLNTLLRKNTLSYSAFNLSGTDGVYFKYSNFTSICTSQNNGWVKVLSVYNASGNYTCRNIISSNYTPKEASVLEASLNSSKALMNYSSGFLYTNSTYTGFSTSINSNSISQMNLFENPYGNFASNISKYNVSLKDSNMTCKGQISSNSSENLELCSYLISPVYQASAFANYSMAESNEVGNRYMLSMYSFTYTNYSSSIVPNAAHLIAALKVNQSVYPWKPSAQSSCQLSNSTLSCRFDSYNQSTSKANFTIKNNGDSPVKITSAACFMPGLEKHYKEDTTINATKEGSISVECSSVLVPLDVAYDNYNLTLNYTENGKPYTISGTAKIAVPYVV